MTEPLLLARKLGIRPGDSVVLLHGPSDFILGDLPEGASLGRPRHQPRPPVEMVIAFFGEAAALAAEIEALPASITVGGALWIAWPRRAGGGRSDLTDVRVRELGLAAGLVDVKVAALGPSWSSLCFVFPLALRGEVERRRAEETR